MRHDPDNLIDAPTLHVENFGMIVRGEQEGHNDLPQMPPLEYEPVEPLRGVDLLAAGSFVSGVVGLFGAVVATATIHRSVLVASHAEWVAIGATACLVSFCGLVAGGLGGDRIERFPERLRGGWIALAGVILNLLTLVYTMGFGVLGYFAF